MKKLAYITLILIIAACGAPETTTTTIQQSEPIPVIIEEPPEPEPLRPRILTIYNQSTAEFSTSDGTNSFVFGTGQAVNAHDGFFVVDDVLHAIDTDTGESLISQRLPCIPSTVAISADTWSFETIPPAVAQQLGAMARTYTKIWKNGTEYGNWFDNQWQVVDAIVTESRDVLALDINGKFRNITDPAIVVHHAEHNGIMIHDVEQTTNHAYITDGAGTTRVSFQYNYFFNARQWQKVGDVWHSWNGYTWDGTALREQVNTLKSFTVPASEYPYLVKAGVKTEHGEEVSYWIECNTGQLYRHTPSIDSLEVVVSLYQGSGLRMDGVTIGKDINPVMTTDGIFYKYAGTVYKYDYVTVSSFAGDVLIWGM